MSLSSLLRGEAVNMVDYRSLGTAATLPRLFGSRVLRGDHVGLDRPVSLAAPAAQRALAENDEELLLAPPPADLADIEEAARVQGYNVGYEQGRAAGTAAVEEATAESIRRLAALVSGVHENHAAFFRAAERQVVDLALQIAQKVVEREIQNIPDMAVHVIRAALEEMDARTALRVRVSPDDEELLRRQWIQVVPSGIGADRIELVADERVQPGGAIIETTHGQVDAQLESKLAQLGNALWTFVMDVHNTPDQPGDIDA
jgi:flagellar assembly protein FliH